MTMAFFAARPAGLSPIRPERPGHGGGQHLDHGDVQVPLARCRGNLGANETAAQHGNGRPLIQLLADRGGVVERPERAEPRPLRAQRMPPGPGPRCDDQRLITNRRAVVQHDLVPGGVQPGHPGGQPEVQTEFGEHRSGCEQRRRRRSVLA